MKAIWEVLNERRNKHEETRDESFNLLANAATASEAACQVNSDADF
jgi:hypothetical protein